MQTNPELSPYESSQVALVALLRSRLRDDDYMVRAANNYWDQQHGE